MKLPINTIYHYPWGTGSVNLPRIASLAFVRAGEGPVDMDPEAALVVPNVDMVDRMINDAVVNYHEALQKAGHLDKRMHLTEEGVTVVVKKLIEEYDVGLRALLDHHFDGMRRLVENPPSGRSAPWLRDAPASGGFDPREPSDVRFDTARPYSVTHVVRVEDCDRCTRRDTKRYVRAVDDIETFLRELTSMGWLGEQYRDRARTLNMNLHLAKSDLDQHRKRVPRPPLEPLPPSETRRG